MVQLSHPYMTTEKTTLTGWTVISVWTEAGQNFIHIVSIQKGTTEDEMVG